jgi:hypothetical protein
MRGGFLLAFFVLLFPAVGHPEGACLTTLPPNPHLPHPRLMIQCVDRTTRFGMGPMRFGRNLVWMAYGTPRTTQTNTGATLPS